MTKRLNAGVLLCEHEGVVRLCNFLEALRCLLLVVRMLVWMPHLQQQPRYIVALSFALSYSIASLACKGDMQHIRCLLAYHSLVGFVDG